mgnify:CR=1 FL=1
MTDRTTVHGLQVATPLFRFVEGPSDLFERLGQKGILVRRFPERPGFFRIGLPQENAWLRLSAALRT